MAEELRKGYRLPTLDEFIDGFEYEVMAEGLWDDCIEDYWGWYTYKFNQGLCWRTIEDIESELRKGNIQVKCGG